jgi:hypothetical protein
LDRALLVLTTDPSFSQDADLTEAIVDYQMSLLNEVKGVGRRVLEIATEKPRRGEKKKKGAAEKNPFT